jgi:hypothetical protein
MATKVLDLKITLLDIHPPIWRQVLVPASVKFFDLHHIIQIAMGWKNSHLFEFSVKGEQIGFIDPASAFEDLVDANEISLEQLIGEPGLKFFYLYDFGDAWRHSIEVQQVLVMEGEAVPICKAGERACPPEDSGGVPGFTGTSRFSVIAGIPGTRKRGVGLVTAMTLNNSMSPQ